MNAYFAVALLAGIAPAADHGSDRHQVSQAVSATAILRGYGNGGFAIRTDVPEAQAFFSNGMELAAAFEHAASKAAFAEAVRLDPNCVMCAWGQAWANGPNINFGIGGDELATAQRLAAGTRALAMAYGTPLEQQLADALVARYTAGGGSGSPGDRAYFKAMSKIATAHPANDVLQALAADAALNTMSENDSAATVAAIGREAMRLLTPVLARNPDFTPAIHFYVHATESAEVPAYAEPYADRLGQLAPEAAHLVHMPSHTYYWIGRYRDAGLVNLRAMNIGVEKAENASSSPFSLPYHSHNIRFGLGGALIAGDGETALKIARPLVRAAIEPGNKVNKAVAGVGLIALALYAPDELLAMPQPASRMMTDYWHYARGEAFAARGDAVGVRGEEKAMRLVPELPPDTSQREARIFATTYEIAHNVLLGRAAMIEGHYERAIVSFAKATRLEEGADYSRMSDPPNWWYPVRRNLAEARLASGDQAGARSDAARTVRRRPRDPGAVKLLQSLR